MISGLGSAHSASYAQYSAMAKQIDTDGDGEVSKSEFVDGAPQGVSSDMASNLFDLLDTQKTGSIQDGDLANAFSQLSDATKFLLIQQQNQNSQGGDGSEDPKKHLDDIFKKLDTDGDGKLSRDEFVAGRPKGMSEEDAGKMFDQLASAAGTDGSNGLSEDQFAQGIEAEHAAAEAAGGHRHHHHHGGGGMGGADSQDPAQTFDALDTNKDGVVSLEEFMAGKPQGASDDEAKSLFDKLTNGNSDAGLTKDQFVQGMEDQADQMKADNKNSRDEMMKQLMSMLESQSTAAGGQSAPTSGSLLDQFAQAIDAYKTASQQAYAASSNTGLIAEAA